MSTKTLFLGIVGPKIFSETKTPALPRARGPLLRPRARVAPSVSRSTTNLVPFINLTIIAGIFVMLGFHLFMVNAYSGKGFELKRTQASITELTEQQKKLIVQQAEMGSIMKVSDVATTYGLVPITSEEFVTVGPLTQR